MPTPQARPTLGLLLLTGGKGERMGAPKYALPFPGGGSWAGHLVSVFEAAFPDAELRILGNPVQERPELPVIEDPRQGPAIALQTWARTETLERDWWWIAACDQMRWDAETLARWFQVAALGPEWTLGRHQGRFQPMGSWLPGSLVPTLARQDCRSVFALVEALPHRLVDVEGPEWLDLDTPEERRAWESARHP